MSPSARNPGRVEQMGLTIARRGRGPRDQTAADHKGSDPGETHRLLPWVQPRNRPAPHLIAVDSPCGRAAVSQQPVRPSQFRPSDSRAPRVRPRTSHQRLPRARSLGRRTERMRVGRSPASTLRLRLDRSWWTAFMSWRRNRRAVEARACRGVVRNAHGR